MKKCSRITEQYASAMLSYHTLKGLILTFLLSFYFPTNYAQQENIAQPEVTIPQGILRGITLTTRNDRNVSAFQGIPYGQPPTGNLRFANPVAAGGWNGTLNASDDTRMCPQIKSAVYLGEEDCLYLNVYTPHLPETTNLSLLPVMVFIHGGAFKEGCKDASRVSPKYLLVENLVLVAVNYRLGPLGFLSTGDEVASGNWGLKDQVLALEWVRDNIRFFGGDPDQVTLFGESAGAGAVHLLTLANATIGLFRRYITQSGSALAKWAHRPRAAYSNRAFELGEFVGCFNDTSDSLISCLRKVNASAIIETQSRFVIWEYLPDIMWGPTDEPDIEGVLLTDSPTNLFAAGSIRDLPWMSGVVRDEGLVLTAALHSDEAMLYDFLNNIDTVLPVMLFWTYESDSGAAWLNATKSYYFNNDLTSSASVLLANLTMVLGDSHFYYPGRNALEQQYALAESSQYFFTFNYRGTYSGTYFASGSTVNYGVAHGDDLFYLFPHDSLFSDLNETMSETDYEMVDTMVQLWTSFAINGTPTALALNGTETWEPYSTEDNYLRIGNESDVALEVQYSFFEERMQFWANLYATVKPESSTSDDSGIATSSPNLLFGFLVPCSIFFLSASIADRFG